MIYSILTNMVNSKNRKTVCNLFYDKPKYY